MGSTKQTRPMNVAILGATGAVGRQMVDILASSEIDVGQIKLLASPRSAGQKVTFRDKQLNVEVVSDEGFKGMDVALFSAGGDNSLKWAPIAAKQGAIVIDNSSAFRTDEKIPLIVPEINRSHLKLTKNKNIIANPNCSTIQMVVPLKPVFDNYGIEKIVVSTYQAVSGAGQKGCEELSRQTMNIYNQKELDCEVFPIPIAFNCISFIGKLTDNGYSDEEMKMVHETHKIFADVNIKVNPTTIRVPVFNSHSLSVHIQTKKPFEFKTLETQIAKAQGVKYIPYNLEHWENLSQLPTCQSATGQDSVYVSRLRNGIDDPNTFSMWSMTDNVRKGAALNAVQIFQCLIEDNII